MAKKIMGNINISIILSNYNHAHFLPTALESIISQTYKPYEVIVVDDASTDNSKTVVAEYIKQYPFIKLLTHKQNLGVHQALNYGLSHATGTHVTFFAADDWLLPTMFAEAVTVLSEYPQAAFWCCGSLVEYEHMPGKLYPAKLNYPLKAAGFISSKFAQKFLFKNGSWFQGNTIIFNRNIYEKNNALHSELISLADNFLYRVLACKFGCCFTPKNLGVWRIRKTSISQEINVSPEALQKIANKMQSLLHEKYLDIFSDQLIARMQSRLNFDIAKALWHKNDYHISNKFKSFIRESYKNNLINELLFICLNVVSLLPFGRSFIGKTVMLIFTKPYDIINTIQMHTKSFFYINEHKLREKHDGTCKKFFQANRNSSEYC